MKDKVDINFDKLDDVEEQVILKEAGLAKKFEKDVEEVQFKFTMLKNQQKIARGTIQQHLDKIDIRNRDRQETLLKIKRELDRTLKKMILKKHVFENMEKAVEDMKNETDLLEKENQSSKTISTLRRTKSNYYKPGKSLESPCKT
jgi:uncharacterized protein (UPF0128 family)